MLLGSSFITSVSGDEASPKPKAQRALFPEGLQLAEVHCKGCRKAAKLTNSPKAIFSCQKSWAFFSLENANSEIQLSRLTNNCKMPSIQTRTWPGPRWARSSPGDGQQSGQPPTAAFASHRFIPLCTLWGPLGPSTPSGIHSVPHRTSASSLFREWLHTPDKLKLLATVPAWQSRRPSRQ